MDELPHSSFGKQFAGIAAVTQAARAKVTSQPEAETHEVAQGVEPRLAQGGAVADHAARGEGLAGWTLGSSSDRVNQSVFRCGKGAIVVAYFLLFLSTAGILTSTIFTMMAFVATWKYMNAEA